MTKVEKLPFQEEMLCVMCYLHLVWWVLRCIDKYSMYRCTVQWHKIIHYIHFIISRNQNKQTNVPIYTTAQSDGEPRWWKWHGNYVMMIVVTMSGSSNQVCHYLLHKCISFAVCRTPSQTNKFHLNRLAAINAWKLFKWLRCVDFKQFFEIVVSSKLSRRRNIFHSNI